MKSNVVSHGSKGISPVCFSTIVRWRPWQHDHPSSSCNAMTPTLHMSAAVVCPSSTCWQHTHGTSPLHLFKTCTMSMSLRCIELAVASATCITTVSRESNPCACPSACSLSRILSSGRSIEATSTSESVSPSSIKETSAVDFVIDDSNRIAFLCLSLVLARRPPPLLVGQQLQCDVEQLQCDVDVLSTVENAATFA
jgi:hypothetical protein